MEVWRGPPDDELPPGWNWPAGWTKTIVQRQGACTATSRTRKDSTWYSPSGVQYRSLVAVQKYLAAISKACEKKEIWRGTPDEDLSDYGGWPPGWSKSVVQRQGGDGRKESYWYSPDGKKFVSMARIKKALSTIKAAAEKKANRTSGTAMSHPDNRGYRQNPPSGVPSPGGQAKTTRQLMENHSTHNNRVHHPRMPHNGSPYSSNTRPQWMFADSPPQRRPHGSSYSSLTHSPSRPSSHYSPHQQNRPPSHHYSPHQQRRPPHSPHQQRPNRWSPPHRKAPPPPAIWAKDGSLKPPPPSPSLPTPQNRARYVTQEDTPESTGELDPFEKAEMAKVIAKKLTGSRLHQALLEKLHTCKKGMTFGRISWGFPDLAKEVDGICAQWQIPAGSISPQEVLKELPQVQFQYHRINGQQESLRFYRAEESMPPEATKPESNGEDAPSVGSMMDISVEDNPTAINKNPPTAIIFDLKRGSSLSTDNSQPKTGSSSNTGKNSANTSTAKLKRGSNLSANNFQQKAGLSSKAGKPPETNQRNKNADSTNNRPSIKKTGSSEPTKTSKESQPKPIRPSSGNSDALEPPKTSGESKIDKGDELAKFLKTILRKKEGFASLQFLLLLLRDTKEWPMSRFEIQSHVLALWGRKDLPKALQKWLEEHLEGYPTSHQSQRAKFIAGRLMTCFLNAKCMVKLSPITKGEKQTKEVAWDMERIKAIADLFVQQEGPQLKPRQVVACKAEEEKEEVYYDNYHDDSIVEFEQQELLEFKEEVTEYDGIFSSNQDKLPEPNPRKKEKEEEEDDYIEVIEIEELPKVKKKATATNASLSSNKNLPSSSKTPTAANEIIEIEELPIVKKGATASKAGLSPNKKMPSSSKPPTAANEIIEIEELPIVKKEATASKAGLSPNKKFPSSSKTPTSANAEDTPDIMNDPRFAEVKRLLQPNGRGEIKRLLQPIRRTSDGVAAMEFLGMLRENYKGRTWPKARKELRSCILSVINIRMAASDPTKAPALEAIPLGLRKWVVDQPMKGLVVRALKSFVAHFEQARCLECVYSRGGKTLSHVVWDFDQVNAIAHFVRAHPLQDRNLDADTDKLAEGWPQEARKATGKMDSRCNTSEIQGSDGNKGALKKTGETYPLPLQSPARNQIGDAAASEKTSDDVSRVDDSLVASAALDILFILKKLHPNKHHWPNRPKSLANFLENNMSKKGFQPPRHFVQLRQELKKGNPLYRMIDKVKPEWVRLKCCTEGNGQSFKWKHYRVDELLQHREARSLPEHGAKAPLQSDSHGPEKIINESCSPPEARSCDQHSSKRPQEELCVPPPAKRQKKSSTPSPSRGLKLDEEICQAVRAAAAKDSSATMAGSSSHPDSCKSHPSSSEPKLGFDSSKGYAMVSVEQLQDPNGVILVPSPPIVGSDIHVLLDLLPRDLVIHLSAAFVQQQCTEIVLDKGRQLVAWAGGNRMKLASSSRPITLDDIAAIVDKLGGFGSDNRAGMDEQLHRVAAVRNRQQEIVGLTMSIGRYVTGSASMISDLLFSDPTKSILFLGEPGSGKTTLLREVASILAVSSKVLVVDTSSEIGGDGDIPHPAIGQARRIMVPSLKDQGNVIAQCVQNHAPDVMVIDKVGLPEEVEAIRTCRDQGIRLIGSVQGSFQRLVQNPRLQGLVVGDVAQGVAGNSGLPIFDVVVEIQNPHEWKIIANTRGAVDCTRKGQKYSVQCRCRNPLSGNFLLKSAQV